MLARNTLLLFAFGHFSSAHAIKPQDSSHIYRDPLTYGPELELVHLYYDEFPTGNADRPIDNIRKLT